MSERILKSMSNYSLKRLGSKLFNAFTIDGGDNYLELNFIHKDTDQHYSVTVKPTDKVTQGHKNRLLEKRISELEKERDEAVFLAEQRRQFIVNGVELGYIPHPTIEEDKAANLTILMCGFDDSHAIEAHNLEQHAMAVAQVEILLRGNDWEDGELQLTLASRSIELSIKAEALKDPS
jgi:hypothetical protein